MATTSFSESLRYGGKLFGLFVLVILLGGGALGAGAYLAVPELQSYLDTGSVETTTTAAGAALAAVGAVVLLVGQFALAYKLIADAVSRGTESEPAVFDAADSGDEKGETEAEPAPTEQPATEGESAPADDTAERPSVSATEDGAPADTSGGASPERAASGPVQAEETAAAPEPEPGPTEEPAQAEPEPAEAGSDGAASETAPAEQTAEEIAFGTTGRETAGPRESAPEETAPGEEPADDNEEYEEDREGMETAGDPSSDPLADGFDDE
jgi:hypothetical protein